MPWTNVPYKQPLDPVTADEWNGLVGNFDGLASGDPNAPKVALPNAITTTTIDTTLVLQPDGLGGVHWGVPSGAANTALMSKTQHTNSVAITGLSSGYWLAHILAHVDHGEITEATVQGFCVVHNGVIIDQHAMDTAGNVELDTLFSLTAGTLTFSHGVARTGNRFVVVVNRVR